MDKFELYKGVWINTEPPHLQKKIGASSCKSMLTGGGYLVRQTVDFDCKEETSFWYVIKDSYEEPEQLHKKTQKYIRRANEKFDIRLVSRERMLEQGYDVLRAACENYRVHCDIPTRESWERRIEACGENYDFWGCVDRETDLLQAFSICKRTGDVCEFETSKANPEFQPKWYVMYGLYHARNRYYLQEKHFRYVISSARSLTEHSNIQDFLIEKFNFRKAYCHLKITYKWWVGLAVRMLYPFRNIIKHPKVQSLLRMEAMARGEY